jgi:hypothetical protein
MGDVGMPLGYNNAMMPMLTPAASHCKPPCIYPTAVNSGMLKGLLTVYAVPHTDDKWCSLIAQSIV